jgi:TolA-binding protein
MLDAGARANVVNVPSVTRFELHQGSAEFDVVPQRGRTFTVVAGAFEVSVVGTRFSVRYEAMGAVAVAVSHGVVSVRGPGREPFRLRAGQRFRSDDGEAKLAAAPEAHEPKPAAPDPGVPSDQAPPPKPAASATDLAHDAPTSADWEAAYRERRYAVAVARAKEQGVERLLGTLSAPKLAALADAARLGGDAELALRALQTVERRFPSSPQAADAEFLVGRLHASRGDSAGALARLEKYLQRGDRAPYAVEAMGRLVELYAARGDTERAQRMAKKYLERAPDGPYRRLCLSVLPKP